MNMISNEKPQYCWDIKLDKNLRTPAKLVALKKGKQLREYISELLKKDIEKEGKLN